MAGASWILKAVLLNFFLTRVASSRQNSRWVLVRVVLTSPKVVVLTRLTFLEGLCPKKQDVMVGSLETLIPFLTLPLTASEG